MLRVMTNKKETIEETFDLALRDANLQDVAVDASELALDSLLDEGLLKDVPIVGTLVKVVSASSTIADKLFLKKLLTFLFHLQEIPPDERAKIILKIDDSKEYRTKVGEKLLYIVDACEDHETAGLVSRVFKHFLEGKITYGEFLKTASVLQRLSLSDFKWLVRQEGHRFFDLSNAGDLMHTGLFELYYHDIQVDIRERYSPFPKELRDKYEPKDDKPPYETEVDGGIDVSLSEAGEIILEVFNPKYERRKYSKSSRLKNKLI